MAILSLSIMSPWDYDFSIPEGYEFLGGTSFYPQVGSVYSHAKMVSLVIIIIDKFSEFCS